MRRPPAGLVVLNSAGGRRTWSRAVSRALPASVPAAPFSRCQRGIRLRRPESVGTRARRNRGRESERKFSRIARYSGPDQAPRPASGGQRPQRRLFDAPRPGLREIEPGRTSWTANYSGGTGLPRVALDIRAGPTGTTNDRNGDIAGDAVAGRSRRNVPRRMPAARHQCCDRHGRIGVRPWIPGLASRKGRGRFLPLCWPTAAAGPKGIRRIRRSGVA